MTTGLENELTQSTVEPRSNRFEGSTYEELMAWLPGSALENNLKGMYESKGWDWENRHAGPWDLYDTNESGRFINDDGEELFFYTGADYEKAHGNRAGMESDAEWVTLSDIREEYEGDRHLQSAFADFETYEAYIRERSDHNIASGKWSYENKVAELLEKASGLGRGPNRDRIDAILKEHNDRKIMDEMAFTESLYEKYGIQRTIYEEDGSELAWNGTGYTLIKKENDDVKNVVTAVALGTVGMALGGPLAGVLQNAGMGSAAATATSKAIINAATQLATTGKIDFKQALVSAAISYGGDKLGNLVSNSDALSGVSGTLSKFEEALSTGNSIADAAIKAGGMSMLTQLVTTGEVDIKQAGLAALMAGGSQAFSEWKASMAEAGQELSVDDLQEIVVEAERVGTDVGGGLTALDGGLVINSNGDILGNMSDLDLDGDGMLSGNDLQEITTNNQYVDPTYTANDNIYGDVDLAPPDSTTNPDAFTTEWADERYDGMSRQQIIDQMQRDGFDDAQISNYIEHWDATNDLNLQELNTTSYGAIDVNMEDKYTIGQTEEGQYYIAHVDENTGEVSFTTVSEEQYNDLYDRMYGSADTGEGALISGDYTDVDDYLVSQSIGSTGNEVTGVNPITGEGEYSPTEGWITLEPGSDTSNAVPIDITNDPVPVEETSDTSNESAANADPNDNVNAGEGDSGGGPTNSTGGQGSTGPSGGGGTEGAGDAAGSPDIDIILPSDDNPLLPDFDIGTDSDVDVDSDGTGLGGVGGDTGGTDSGEGTGGTGGGSESGSGTDAGPDVGVGTGTGEGGSGGGSGDSGDTAGGDGTGGGLGDGGGTGEGTGGGENDGDGQGGSEGVGTGSGTEPGSGDGGGGGGSGGSGGGSGMFAGMGGGAGAVQPKWTPLEWSSLFEGPLTAKQKAAVAPKLEYLNKARGMLS